MKFVIEASGGGDYGDFATVRLYFDDSSWIEVDGGDAHGEFGPNAGKHRDKPYSQGAKVTVHDADGREEVVWDGVVMPGWFAERLRKAEHAD